MKHILVVDDDKNVVRFLERGLTLEGYKVTSCMSGDAALLHLAQTLPDLVILDWMLPGLPGDEILLRLLEQHQKPPVIMLSARDSAFDKSRILKSGADVFLSKPVDFGVLLGHIRALVQDATSV
ncbi:MAG: response regulator transcription factor [Trueperaceae bacterium]